jgi:hypothetical protein
LKEIFHSFGSSKLKLIVLAMTFSLIQHGLESKPLPLKYHEETQPEEQIEEKFDDETTKEDSLIPSESQVESSTSDLLDVYEKELSSFWSELQKEVGSESPFRKSAFSFLFSFLISFLFIFFFF